MLYKSAVSVRDAEGFHVFEATREEAEHYVACRLAVAIDRGFAFCGQIQLLVSREELQQEFSFRERTKGRPRPSLRPPASSTGDAGRGMTLIGRYRVLHLERQAALYPVVPAEMEADAKAQRIA